MLRFQQKRCVRSYPKIFFLQDMSVMLVQPTSCLKNPYMSYRNVAQRHLQIINNIQVISPVLPSDPATLKNLRAGRRRLYRLCIVLHVVVGEDRRRHQSILQLGH